MLHFRVITACLLFSCLVLLSCNKVIEEVELPPFFVYPNPCVEVFYVHLDSAVPASVSASLRVLDTDGKEMTAVNPIAAGSPVATHLMGKPKGVYYAEASIDGEIFTQALLKAE